MAGGEHTGVPLIAPPPSTDASDVRTWRKAQRDCCIAWRIGIDETRRDNWDGRIAASLLDLLQTPAGSVIGFCWPYRSEFDARTVVGSWCAAGAIAALPEVVGKDLPMRFRQWWTDAPMRRGAYDIPVPDGTPEVRPDVLVLPVNAFDECGYRLGYGGGYFDRTLAILAPSIVTIGVAYEQCRLPTIYPQAHDRAMDFVVTESGVYAEHGGALAALHAGTAHPRMERVFASRGIPGEML